MLSSPKDRELRDKTSIRAFVDAHVHIHECCTLQKLLDGAARNFDFQSPTAERYARVLCLTESEGVDRFEDILQRADDGSSEARGDGCEWRFKHSNDDNSVIAWQPDKGEIEIVAGRQIITAERLEVQALGTRRKWADGLPASDVIESIIECGAIPALPWGFGKWLGRRGRVIESLIRGFANSSLYISDNGGRPTLISEPKLFAMARDLGFSVLAGSDSLPFVSECGRAGSFGFYVDGVDDHDGIWSGLRSSLAQDGTEIHRFGSLESPIRFLRNQVAMQLKKRVGSQSKVP